MHSLSLLRSGVCFTGNQLVGNIPEELKGCKRLQQFKVHDNKLGGEGEGPLPPPWMDEKTMPKLKKCFLLGNLVEPVPWEDLKDKPLWARIGETNTDWGYKAIEEAHQA